MPRQGFYPGVFVSRLQYRKGRQGVELDADWNVFARPRVVQFTAEQATKVVDLFEAKDPRQALLESGLDLRAFKEVHFSLQAALATFDAQEELASVRVNLPDGAPEADQREAATLQSPDRVLAVLAEEFGTKPAVLKTNAQTLTALVALRDRLRRHNSSDSRSYTSVDSELGRRLGFGICSLHDDLNEKFAPARRAEGKIVKINQLEALTGLATIPPALAAALRGTLLDPTLPCFCTPFSYTWIEKFTKTWHYTLQIDYPCGVKWCHKRVWGVRVAYPCGVKYCTKSITFTFQVNLSIGFEARVECTGVIVMAAGTACITVGAGGVNVKSCIEAYAIGGAGADVDITIGTQQGQCLYGLALVIGLRATVGSYTIWQGSFGYDYSFQGPCVNQLNTDCTNKALTAAPHLLPGGTIPALVGN